MICWALVGVCVRKGTGLCASAHSSTRCSQGKARIVPECSHFEMQKCERGLNFECFLQEHWRTFKMSEKILIWSVWNALAELLPTSTSRSCYCSCQFALVQRWPTAGWSVMVLWLKVRVKGNSLWSQNVLHVKILKYTFNLEQNCWELVLLLFARMLRTQLCPAVTLSGCAWFNSYLIQWKTAG